MNCSCKETYDIRARCLPKNRMSSFKFCPVKMDTALWIAENDYEFHYEFHNKKRRNGYHTKHFKRLFGLAINKEEGKILLALSFKEEEEQSEEEEDANHAIQSIEEALHI